MSINHTLEKSRLNFSRLLLTEVGKMCGIPASEYGRYKILTYLSFIIWRLRKTVTITWNQYGLGSTVWMKWQLICRGQNAFKFNPKHMSRNVCSSTRSMSWNNSYGYTALEEEASWLALVITGFIYDEILSQFLLHRRFDTSDHRAANPRMQTMASFALRTRFCSVLRNR